MQEIYDSADYAYAKVIEDILDYGQYCKNERTGEGTYSLFDYNVKIDCSNLFPLISLKKVNVKGFINEFLWMVVHGSTDVTWLQERGHKFWDSWVDSNNTIGKGYGKQYRDCHGVDQVQRVIESLKNDPSSRRHIIDLWTVDEIEEMTLPPCHSNHNQFYVRNGALSLAVKARSQDVLLGLPMNWAYYGLLLNVIAHLTDLKVGILSVTATDIHIYENHINQCNEILSRFTDGDGWRESYPVLNIEKKHESIDEFNFESFEIEGYKPMSAVTGMVAV